MAVLTSFSTVFTFKKLVDCNTTSHSLQQQQHNNIIMSSSADVARLTLALDKERKGRLLAEEKLREAGKESSKQQKQNNGRNYLLKKKKTSYEEVNNRNLGPYIKNLVLKYCKFLPAGWDAYTPRARNSLCYQIFDGVVDVPFNCVPEIYWNVNIVPFISAWIVNWRSNANEGIKKVFMGKF